MNKTTLSTDRLELNAQSLYTLLANLQMEVDLTTLYVQRGDGKVFTHAVLEEERLTDGSVVHNLVLS